MGAATSADMPGAGSARMTLGGVPTAEFLGVRIDLLTRDKTVALVVDAVENRRRLQHGVVNVAKLVKMRRDADLKYDVEQSDLVNVDGAGIVWGARLLGIPVPERVAGIDLFMDLLELCERRGFRPFLFGATQEVLERAIAAAMRRHPRLAIAGARNGYFDPADEPAIAEQIRATRADMLFVAISSPIKERFIARYRDVINVPLLMGVGGSFDVIAGHVGRAPAWMQHLGLEWLFRVLQEPRRMWKRYLVTNTVYAGLLASELVNRASERLRRKQQRSK
jgi:N-acetylglucosaminyldiphosphoundecaprenol N-acetyl-beta-D-mannosaminyltransferase